MTMIEWTLYSKYKHQIKWATACNINLDICTSGLLQNQLIDLLSTHTSNLSRFHLVNIVRP